MTPHTVCGIIPARIGSTRFPKKPLALIAGRPLLEWVIRGCTKSKSVGRWIVATDDRRIGALAQNLGVEAIMTPRTLKSGSDRVAYVARGLSSRLIVNWQGDEWLPDGRPIDRLVESLRRNRTTAVATLARPLAGEDAENPNRVKVVLSSSQHALYFSRAPIPYSTNRTTPTLLHVGAYAFKRQMLLQFASWPKTPLERREQLEQLRLLEHDIPIVVTVSRVPTFGVDTPADARLLERYLTRRRA
jgi:3-deoxy-manno-octulosonate cytidylyltransferase (CMP-KDO synthetase)